MALVGVWTNSSTCPLTQAQQENNAYYIYSYLSRRGWTMEAVAALLGNMQVESYINPGQWESAYPIYGSGGFGLVQWTPWSKYTNWAGDGWESNYTKQLERLVYEVDADIAAPNTGQWIAVSSYGYMSFYDFTQSTTSVDTLTMCFEYSYERGTPMSSTRIANARRWYEYLGGQPHPSGGMIPIWLLFKMKERRK